MALKGRGRVGLVQEIKTGQQHGQSPEGLVQYGRGSEGQVQATLKGRGPEGLVHKI